MARKRTPGLPPAKPTDTAFRLKVALDFIKPMIWRRIELPDCTLEDLHLVIQAAMPWWNYHLWSFTVGKHRFGPEMEDTGFGFDDDGDEPARDMWLSTVAAAGVKQFRYTYDFGDGWEHKITLEKPVARDPKAKYPRCAAGERACPPEDCGGVPGYYRLLDILADRKHPEHKDMVEWLGRPYDPEGFDLDAANRELKKVKLTPAGK